MKYELYKLTFPNEKIYIGIASSIPRRMRDHRNGVKSPTAQTPIARAIRKYGWENVRLNVLVVGSKDYIANLEIAAILGFGSNRSENGYNVHLGGSTSPMKVPEVARRVGLAHRGRKQSEAHRAANSAGVRQAYVERGDEITRKRLEGLSRAYEERGDEIRAKLRIRNYRRAGRDGPAPVPTPWTRGQRMEQLAEARKGLPAIVQGVRWITDGVRNRRVLPDILLEDGWCYGYTPSERFKDRSNRKGIKRSMSMSKRELDQLAIARSKSPIFEVGSRWVNDGRKNLRLRPGQAIPNGFRFGMINRSGIKSKSANHAG